MGLSPRLAVLLLLTLSATAAGAEPAIVVGVQKSGEGFVVEASVDVAVPVRVAWGVLTDFDHMKGILGNLTSSRVVSRNGSVMNVMQEGTAHYGFFSYSFFSEREIRLEPMRRILAQQLTGTLKRFASETGLSETDRGTQLHYRAEIVPDSAIARALGASFIEHEVDEELTALAAEMARRQSL